MIAAARRSWPQAIDARLRCRPAPDLAILRERFGPPRHRRRPSTVNLAPLHAYDELAAVRAVGPAFSLEAAA